MARLNEEKIPHKVLRIICLCLIVVIIGVVIGIYFITKKSVEDTFILYKEIVASDIAEYGERSLYEADRDIVVTYQRGGNLQSIVSTLVTDAEITAAQDKIDQAQNDTDRQAAERELEELKIQKERYNLLQTQYYMLLLYSNNYFNTYIEELAKQNNSLSRSKMNGLYKQVESLQDSIKTFEHDKLTLEQKTNTAHGEFDVLEENTLLLLKEHMESYAKLISDFVNMNKTFVSVHIELNGLTNALNDYNAKIMLNYAIMYATSYIVISEFQTLSNSDEYLEDHTGEDLFNLVASLYDKNQRGIKATTDTKTYSFLYNRTKNIYAELDALSEAAKNVKEESDNELYQKALDGGKQDVITFLEAVDKVITVV